MIEPNRYSVATGGAELLDRVEPLWSELRHHHAELSPRWGPGLLKLSFENRRAGLIEKSGGGLQVILVSGTEGDVGYCVASISAENHGEIDSLFVQPNYRKRGLGKRMMDQTLEWFTSKGITSIAVEVITGNDAAMRFYERYGFASRTTRLLQTQTSE